MSVVDCFRLTAERECWCILQLLHLSSKSCTVKWLLVVEEVFFPHSSFPFQAFSLNDILNVAEHRGNGVMICDSHAQF